MGELSSAVRRHTGDGTNIHRLTLTLAVIQRLLVKQTENGAVTQSQVDLLNIAIAAGRSELRQIKLDLENNREPLPTIVSPLPDLLLLYTIELEHNLDILQNCVDKLKFEN